MISTTTSLPESASVTLTAKWTPVEYTLTPEWVFQDFDSDPTVTCQTLPKFTIETASIDLPIPTATQGAFLGWYRDAACTQLITQLSGADLGANATIYGLWTNENQYTVKFEGDHYNNVDYNNDTNTYTPSTLTSATLPTIPDYTNDPAKDKYFVGWYYNGQKVTDFSFINESTTEGFNVSKDILEKGKTYTITILADPLLVSQIEDEEYVNNFLNEFKNKNT